MAMSPQEWQQYQQWLQMQGFVPNAGIASVSPASMGQFNPVMPQSLPSNLPGVTPIAPGLPANINTAPIAPTSSELPTGLTQGLGNIGTAAGLIPGLAPVGFGLAGTGALLGLLGSLGVFDSGLNKTAKTSALASGLQQGGNPLQALVGQYMAGGANQGNPLSNPAFGSSVEQVSSMLEALTNQQVPPITLTGAFDNPVHWQASPVSFVEKLLQLPKGVQLLDTSNQAGLQTAYADIAKDVPTSGPLSGGSYLKDFNSIVQQLLKQGVLQKSQTPTAPAGPNTLNVAQGIAGTGNPLDQAIAQYLGNASAGNPTFSGKLPGTTQDIATILEKLTGQTTTPGTFQGVNGQPQNLNLGAPVGGPGQQIPQGFNFLGTDANSLQAALQAIQKNIPSGTGNLSGGALNADFMKIVQQLISQGVLTRPGSTPNQAQPQAGQGAFPTAAFGQAAPAAGVTTTQGLPHPLGASLQVPFPYPAAANALYPLAY